jgi:uncharacterized protein
MMTRLKIGDALAIHSYKHNGCHHRTWSSATLMHNDEDKIIVVCNKADVYEEKGRHWITREPAVSIFYKKNWFNIICMLREAGIFYYCNMASPSLIDDLSIKYIDYDLDLKIQPDGKIKLLDEFEYLRHKEEMKYPTEIDSILWEELSKLKSMVKNGEAPFSNIFPYTIYKQYLNMQEEIESALV